MVYGVYVKQQMRSFRAFHNHGSPIASALGREGISVSHVGIHKLLVKYQEKTEAAVRHAGSGRPQKVTGTIKTTHSIVKREKNEDARLIRSFVSFPRFRLIV